MFTYVYKGTWGYCSGHAVATDWARTNLTPIWSCCRYPKKTWDGELRRGCDWWGVGFAIVYAKYSIWMNLLPIVEDFLPSICGEIAAVHYWVYSIAINFTTYDFNINSRSSSQRMIWYPHMILCRVALGCIGYKRAYEAWGYGNRNVVDTIGQTHIIPKKSIMYN